MKTNHLLFVVAFSCFLLMESKGEQKHKFPFMKNASNFKSLIKGKGRVRYDYIIVGGGTAGCPLAATLSRHFKVLLLERGGSPYGNPNISYMSNFHISLADTSPTSASQYFLSTDGVFNTRAKVLGGGTCINAGFYSRANPSFVEEAGWNPKLVREAYPWIENQIVYWPKLVSWQEAVRDGLLEVGVSPFNGYTYDHVYGTKVGGTLFDKDGIRHTAADLLETANPDNLSVLLHASVQKILFDDRGRRPKALGVVFSDENGKQHRLFLSKMKSSEVILSAGAIGSPQLLLLSGIGPKSELHRMKIPVVLNNKFVGKGMTDNPMNSIFIPTKEPVEQSLIQTVGITKSGSFIEASSGFGQSTDSIHSHQGIMSAEIGQLSTIPPKKRTFETIKAFVENKHDLPREIFMGGFLLEKIDGPLSRGHLSLVTTDPNDNPNITFNYFQHPEDLKRCVDGIRTLEKIARSKSITRLTKDDKYTMEMLLNMTLKANVNLIPKHTNDTTSLEQFCKDTVITIWHYHGGCHVDKVVDQNYHVIGVDRVRVVDGSTFSQSPGTNPQATVMMFGRYMGVQILRERLGETVSL